MADGAYRVWAGGATRIGWLLALAAVLGCMLWGQRSDAAPAPRWRPQLGVPRWWDTDSRDPLRMILIYNSGTMPPWTADKLRYYVAHINAAGKPDDWFFDTVLVLALAAQSRGFEPNYGNGPSIAEDWRWYLDERMFGGASELAELEKAVDEAGTQLGDKSHTMRVIIGIPYPDTRATDFGALDGRKLSFVRPEDRAEAVRWYLRQVAQRWTASHFEHLRIGGFYWVREEAPAEDRPVLKLASELVANQLLPFYWIPYFGSHGGEQWRELGFDAAIQQPNYFFYDVPQQRIGDAAQFARQHAMGVEMEMDRRVLQSEERRQRYHSYLMGGIEHGYLQAAMLAWYDDCALLECGKSTDPAVRHVYDDTYAFVRGTFRKHEYASGRFEQRGTN